MPANIELKIKEGIGEICFSHPKANSLPGELLKKLAQSILDFGKHRDIKVILIKSEGVGAFCAGASFEEFEQLTKQEDAEKYFSGFAKVILAIKNTEKIVIARVQGKAVGGGVGLIAACDYVFACQDAAVRLTELSLGIGPFVIGPAIERKIGKSFYTAMSLDCNWREANWSLEKGLFSSVAQTVQEMDSKIEEFLAQLKKANFLALLQLKKVFWEGTENWEALLQARAKNTADCLLANK